MHWQYRSEIEWIVPYNSLKYKEALLFLSWGRIPLIWVSWISFKQMYELTLIFDLVVGFVLLFYALITSTLTDLEDQTYGMFDYYCN